MGAIRALFKKEVQTEWRHKASLGGLLLYVGSSVYICFLSFKKIIDPPTWNALFWILIVFASINSVSKIYLQESKGRVLFMNSIADARSVWIAKSLYNALLVFVVSVMGFAVYSLVLGNLVQDRLFYFLALLIGSLGFSSLLTSVAAIASKANYNFTLMAILSFPVLIPFLITLIKFSKNAMDGLDRGLSFGLIVIMLAIISIQVALSYLLIPYLWRD